MWRLVWVLCARLGSYVNEKGFFNWNRPFGHVVDSLRLVFSPIKRVLSFLLDNEC